MSLKDDPIESRLSLLEAVAPNIVEVLDRLRAVEDLARSLRIVVFCQWLFIAGLYLGLIWSVL